MGRMIVSGVVMNREKNAHCRIGIARIGIAQFVMDSKGP